MTIFNPYNWCSEKEIDEVYNVLASLYCSKSYLQAYQLASNLLDIIEKHLDSSDYRGELKDDVLCSLVNGHKQRLGELYQLAGEIASILNKPEEALTYYQKFQYWNGQTKNDASLGNRDAIIVYSFRAFNTYSMFDLINSQITCGRPSCMNDPFDSIFNSWSKEHILKHSCKEQTHIQPYGNSFKGFRIRSFIANTKTYETDNTILTDQITMWSHYADNHKGFCIKYRLSHRFIKQEQYSSLSFCCIKPIKYVKQINNIKDMSSINNELAFFTKASCWNSECEVRLLDYDKGNLGDFKQLELDKESQIEEISFGCRCTAQTIKNIIQISSLLSYGTRIKFYKMKENDTGNIYKLQKVPVLPHKYLHNIK